MELVKPNESLLEKYRDAVVESYENDIEEWKPFDPSTFEDWKKSILAIYEKVELGENLPEGLMKMYTYWCIDKDELIGEVQIRPTLENEQRFAYGHISYAIKYSKLGMGYGSEALRLALSKSNALGLSQVNIVCRASNIGSNRVVEKNGGKLIAVNKDDAEDACKIYEIKLGE